MVRKLNGIECRLVQHIFLPTPCKKSVGDGEIGVGRGGGGGCNDSSFWHIKVPLLHPP